MFLDRSQDSLKLNSQLAKAILAMAVAQKVAPRLFALNYDRLRARAPRRAVLPKTGRIDTKSRDRAQHFGRGRLAPGLDQVSQRQSLELSMRRRLHKVFQTSTINRKKHRINQFITCENPLTVIAMAKQKTWPDKSPV
ncbi:MAG: hypothetical protein L0219_00220 [Phycisphaerales bacterium]|nr:hypothetical protein [Phycisphaerales bacterium]